jgi:hypothetical protein
VQRCVGRDRSHPGRSEVRDHALGRAVDADDRHPRRAELLLTARADLGEDQLAAVALDLLVTEPHDQSWSGAQVAHAEVAEDRHHHAVLDAARRAARRPGSPDDWPTTMPSTVPSSYTMS